MRPISRPWQDSAHIRRSLQFLNLVARLGAGLAASRIWLAQPRALARPTAQQGADEPAPTPFWPPDFPLDPPGKAIDD